MSKTAQREAAAKKLEALGWALIRYARRILRCVDIPEETKYERSAEDWHAEGKRRFAEFHAARREYLNGR